MKLVFYKTLLKRGKNLTANERILYSFLVSKSISRIDEVFDKNGQMINYGVLLDVLNENNNKLPLCEISHAKLAKELGVTRVNIINGFKHLRELGYILQDSNGKDYVFTNEILLEHGYFLLADNKDIGGELLIFYSYLIDRINVYDNCVDIPKERLAVDIGKTFVATTKLLNRLYDLGLAKRLENGKIFIKT